MWEKVEKRMTELHMKRADLARALGVDNQHVYNWSRRGLPSDRYRDVARALDMPASWLFEDDSDEALIVSEEASDYSLIAHDLESLAAIVRGLSTDDRQKLIRIAQVFSTSPSLQTESIRRRGRINEKNECTHTATRKKKGQ